MGLFRRSLALSLVLWFATGSAHAAVTWDWQVSALICTVAAIGIDALTLGTATPIMLAAAASVGLHVCGLSVVWSNPVGVAPPPILNMVIATDSRVSHSTPPGWSAVVTPPSTVPVITPPDRVDFIVDGVAIQPRFDLANGNNLSWFTSPAPGNVADLEAFVVENFQPPVYTVVRDVPNQNIVVMQGTSPLYAFHVRATPDCPAGYMLDIEMEDCVIKNAAQVMKPVDGKCEITKVDGFFVKDPQDPDCVASTSVTGSGTNRLVVQGSANSAVVVDGDASGFAGDPTAGGSASVNAFDPVSNTTTRVITHWNTAGDIDSTSQSVPSGNGVDAGAVGTGTGTGTGSSSWPSDYSKAGEAAAAAQTLHTDFTATTTTGDPVSRTEDELKSVWFQTGPSSPIGSLLAWRVPGHASTCPTLTFPASVYFPDVVMDYHCTLFTNFAPTIALVFNLLYSLSALMIVLKA